VPEKLKVLDLFSGIGGFSLGLERTGGFETVAFCEIEPYCQKVLKKHWPEVPIYEDVREVTAERLKTDGISVDVITGGFPCQDISVAGRQEGIEGERSGLWSECARLLGELQPQIAIFENVTALLSGDRGKWFQRVLWDISQVGYDAEWHCIPARAVGAKHKRDRIWIVSYPNRARQTQCKESTKGFQYSRGGVALSQPGSFCGNVSNPDSQRLQGRSNPRGPVQNRKRLHQLLARCYESNRGGIWEFEPSVGRVANGIPSRVNRLRGLGNAVVPQIPEMIGHEILETERGNNHE